MGGFELKKSNNVVTVRMKDNRTKKQELDDFAVGLVKGSGKNGMELAALGNGIHRKFADFKVKDYGYSTFSKFVNSIGQLEVRENKNNNKTVYLKKKKTKRSRQENEIHGIHVSWPAYFYKK